MPIEGATLLTLRPEQDYEGSGADPAASQGNIVSLKPESSGEPDADALAETLRQMQVRLQELKRGTGSPVIQRDIVPFPSPATTTTADIIPVDFISSEPSAPGDNTLSPLATTQLPTDAAPSENSAADSAVTEKATRLGQPVKAAMEGPTGTAPARISEPRQPAREVAGTSAARKEKRMESSAYSEPPQRADEQPDNSGDDSIATPVAPRLTGGPVLEPAGRDGFKGFSTEMVSGQGTEISGRSVEASATIERISKLVSQEAVMFRQHGSDSMAMVLRPDEHTELFLHLSQRNGQIEASVRCEKGDFQQLNALWSQLQESLSQQKVRLAPLQESSSDSQGQGQPGQNAFRSPGGFDPSGGRDGSPSRQPRSDQESLDEWPAPASPSSDPTHVQGRRGSRQRLTTSRPGWETWA